MFEQHIFLVLRLVGGRTENEGNVFLGDSPVCDDDWGCMDGQVVCRQLGYPGLVNITKESYFGNVSSVFAMDDVRCNGTEARLVDCPHNPSENCNANEGAGVLCQCRAGVICNMTLPGIVQLLVHAFKAKYTTE